MVGIPAARCALSQEVVRMPAVIRVLVGSHVSNSELYSLSGDLALLVSKSGLAFAKPRLVPGSMHLWIIAGQIEGPCKRHSKSNL